MTSRDAEPPDQDRRADLAALLAVEPMDDLTRMRLVRTALDASRGGARPRTFARHTAVAAAAVLLAVAAIGLTLRVVGTDGSSSRAADAPAEEQTEGGAAAPRDSFEDEPAPSAAVTSLAALGALGDVSTEAALRTVASDAAARPPSVTPANVSACAYAVAAALGQPVAAGSATFHGEAATVIIVEEPSGHRVAIVVDTTCARRLTVRSG